MRAFPKNTPEALRHLPTIEVDVTSLIDVFCVGSSLPNITRSYRKLALLVHPDRVARYDPRGSARCMGVLSRALELVKIEAECHEITSGRKAKNDFLVPSYVVFSRAISDHEEFVNDHEVMEKRKSERLNRRNTGRESPSSHQKPTKQSSEDYTEHSVVDCEPTGTEAKEKAEARRAAELRAAREEAAKTALPHEDREESGRKQAEVQARLRNDEEAHKNKERRKGDNSCHIDSGEDFADQEGDCGGEESEDADEISDMEDDSDELLQDEDYSPADYIADYNSGDECQKEDGIDTTSLPFQTNARSNDYEPRCSPPREIELPTPLDARNRRRLQKKKSKQRALERAKAALKAERVAAMTWKPWRCVPVTPVVGMCLDARWKCEQLIRAQTAYLAVQKGVSIHQTVVKVVMKCRVKTCHATFVFDLQPKSGNWKLNKYLQHGNDCFGQQVPVPGSSPTRRRG